MSCGHQDEFVDIDEFVGIRRSLWISRWVCGYPGEFVDIKVSLWISR